MAQPSGVRRRRAADVSKSWRWRRGISDSVKKKMKKNRTSAMKSKRKSSVKA